MACNTYSGENTTDTEAWHLIEAVDEAPEPTMAEDMDGIVPNENTEQYDEIIENDFKKVSDAPLSTFGIDVDRASYANVRRFLNASQLPPANAVRIEEMINYFHYDYPQPTAEHPFSITTEVSACPWNEGHRLAHIGLKGRNIDTENIPPSNLVFLLDVSGSMSDYNKLPLLKESFKMLVDQLRPEDRISIVVYAGASGVVLPSTPGNEKQKILNSLNALEAGGSTAGGEGIILAYKIALQNFIENGNNRVILATDGDFNVGASSDEALVSLIENRRDKGVFLTILGFGTGNYKDSKMEKLADNGNGNYAYIDNLNEAKKVLITEMSGTLFTIAKDVKLQLEFNEDYVAEYRLIGYENRVLRDEDFDNDKKDAGDMGAGHTVTALYEIIPKKRSTPDKVFDVKLRYKQPDADQSTLLQVAAMDNGTALNNTSNNYRFSAAVANFGMLLRDSKYKGTSDMVSVATMARGAKGADLEGYREEFIQLIEQAKVIQSATLETAEE